MKKRENILLLLFGPTVKAVGLDMLSRDVFRGLGIILMAVEIFIFFIIISIIAFLIGLITGGRS